MLKRNDSRTKSRIKSKKFYDFKKHLKKWSFWRICRFRDKKKTRIQRVLKKLSLKVRVKKRLIIRRLIKILRKDNLTRTHRWDYNYEDIETVKNSWYPRRRKKLLKKFRTSKRKLFGYQRKFLRRIACWMKKKTRQNKFKKIRFLFNNNKILKIKKISSFSFEDEENNLKSFYSYIDCRINPETLKKLWLLKENHYYVYWYFNIFNFK